MDKLIDQLNVKIYADGAVLADMLAAYKSGIIRGFTTNPSLMKKPVFKTMKHLQSKHFTIYQICQYHLKYFPMTLPSWRKKQKR